MLKKCWVLDRSVLCLFCFSMLMLAGISLAQVSASQPASAAAQSPSAPPARSPAAVPPPAVRITLDQAINLAFSHSHVLKAAQTTIQQAQAEEITANLRPNPVIAGDSLFLPIFGNPSGSNTTSTVNQLSEFDLGISYLIERGRKRQHRLQAARDLTT